MDNRIVELEKKAAFQERLLAELNTLVFEQGKAMDRLLARFKALEGRLTDNEALVKPVEGEDPPPHY